MRKLAVIVFITVSLMVFLFLAAFFYVDLSGHIGYQYKLVINGASSGIIKLDRYVTEDKIIYKSNAEYTYSSGYPEVKENLFLNKKNKMPLKFVRRAIGLKGRKCLTLLVQDEEKYNFLFLKHPEFITLENVKPDMNSVIFSPEDIMLYMPLIERYNFWKKGTQFFNCIIPVDEAVPPVAGKIEIRQCQDEYIPIMGCKVEAESFVIKSEILPDVRIFLSKYMHRILIVEIKEKGMKFILTRCNEGPGKRIEYLRRKVGSLLKYKNILPQAIKEKLHLSANDYSSDGMPITEEQVSLQKINIKEVFFESGDFLLFGEIWIPEGEGTFPAIIIPPKEGPVFEDESILVNSFGEFFSGEGFIVFTFDNPGQGKSQRSFMSLDDEKKIKNIASAVKYLEKHPLVEKDHIALIGPPGGAYLTLETAGSLPEISSCVLFNMPLRSVKDGLVQIGSMKEELKMMLNAQGFKEIKESVLENMAARVAQYRESIMKSVETFSFFLGAKIPVKEYHDFLIRDPYEAVRVFNKPLLMIFEKDNAFFDSQGINALKKLLSEKKSLNKVSIFRNLGFDSKKVTEDEASRNLAFRNDVLRAIKEWILKSNASKKKKEQKQ